MVQCSAKKAAAMANVALNTKTRKISISNLMNILLNNNRVRMRQASTVETKLEAMAQAGCDKFMVISDFDYTLTRYQNNGKRCATTHGLFEQIATETSPEFLKQIIELRDKYLPIEFCPQMKIEQKMPYMEAWWNESHELIVKHDTCRDLLRKTIKRTQMVQLRDGCSDLLWKLSKANIPLILFSAGIGQIIEYVLQYQANHRYFHGDSMLQNLYIISNFMRFSEQGICTGFDDPLIHTFNKNRSVIKQDAPFLREIADRTNVLLLGDSLGDVHMDVGIENEVVVLKIGYLNFDFENLLERYLNEYDIVLIDDQTMTVPDLILTYIDVSSNNEMETTTVIPVDEIAETENATGAM